MKKIWKIFYRLMFLLRELNDSYEKNYEDNQNKKHFGRYNEVTTDNKI